MKNIGGYRLLGKINETGYSVLYRARRAAGGGHFIVKVTDWPKKNAADIAMLRQRYENLRCLKIDGVLSPLDVLEYEDGMALVYENLPHPSLASLLSQKPMDILVFFNISIRLSEILSSLHQQGIVHRNLKPSNIMISSKWDQCLLTDMGMLPPGLFDQGMVCSPQVINSVLPYIAPEQTGRINRGVDSRADLYALGTVFYEILTGRPPFFSDDPMQILHAHIAKAPVAPAGINENISSALSDLVMKLLQKAAEDRYQTAAGLVFDLSYCRQRYTETGSIEPFALGAKDFSLDPRASGRMVGRDSELSVLRTGFEDMVRQKQPVISVVTGPPGIGKSALAEAAVKSLEYDKCYWISGSYDAFRKDVPYSAIIQAFMSLISMILTEGPEKLNTWKKYIHASLGSGGKVIAEVIPMLEQITGKLPEVPDLGPEAARNRFIHMLCVFIEVFTRSSRPLVIFLDNMQWADRASLRLLPRLAAYVKNRCLWLILAWRVNGQKDSSELARTLDESQKAGWHVVRLDLKALDDTSANEMVSDLLKARPEIVSFLTKLVMSKAGGNPFFIKQFVQNLYEKNLLGFEPDSGWSWDESEIRKLQVTDNLVDLMGRKINRLPEECRDALKTGACIGSRFDLSTLSAVMDKELDTLLKSINPALKTGLLQFAGEVCTFSHDRLREAAYGLLRDSEKAALHSKIGWHVYWSVSDKERHAQAFYIVNHLNSGWVHIRTSEQRRLLAMLNLTAGKKARQAAAYHSALVYLRISISLLDPGSWGTDYRQVLATYTEAAKAAYLSAKFGEMERYVGQVTENAVSVLDTIDVREIQIQACLARRMIDEAVEITGRVLSSLGVRLPRSPGVIRRSRELWSVDRVLGGKTDKEILQYPLMNDPFYQGAMRIAKSGLIAFYIGGHPRNTATLVLCMVKLSFKRGLCPQTPYWLGAYSVLLFSLNRMKEAFRFGDLALKMADQPGAEQIHTRYLVNSQILHWRDPVRQCCRALQENYSLAIEMGDIEYSAYCALQYCHMSFSAGLALQLLADEAGQYSSILKQYGQMVPFHMISLLQQVLDNLMGRSDCPTRLSGARYEEKITIAQKKKSRQRTGLFLVYTYKLMLCYLFGELQKAEDAGEKAKRYLDAGVGLDSFVLFYFYRSLNILSGFAQLPASGKKKQWLKVEKAVDKLRLWALHAPRNHLFKRDLVEAEMARVEGHLLKAEDLYHKAINQAGKTGFLHEEALACELAGLFYRRRQMDDIAALMLKRSMDCYQQWGASAKASQIGYSYSELIKDFDKFFHDNSKSADKPGVMHQGFSLDLSTVVKAFQAVSGEIVLEKLLTRLMQIGIEYAGAQRGVMLLNHQGKLYAETEADAAGNVRVLKSVPFEKYTDVSVKIVSYVHKTIENVIIDDAGADERFFSDPYVNKHELRSVLCAPIRRNKEISGIFYAENNLTTGAFSRQKMELLTLLSAQAAIAIENARLFEIARRDGLTGLINHRYFRYSLEKELAYAAEKNHSVALLMLDIDHFKDFNDTHGHQAGDAVLSQVAAVIQTYSPDPDLAGRYGGEEFAMICPAITFEDARSLAEKVRRHVNGMEILYQGLKLKVTISIGIAATYLAGAADSSQLISQADKALYKAKASGRNRVAV